MWKRLYCTYWFMLLEYLRKIQFGRNFWIHLEKGCFALNHFPLFLKNLSFWDPQFRPYHLDEKTHILSVGCSVSDSPIILTERGQVLFKGWCWTMYKPGAWGDEKTWWGDGTHFILQPFSLFSPLFPSSQYLFGFSHLLRTSKITMVESKLEAFANPPAKCFVSRASWSRSARVMCLSVTNWSITVHFSDLLNGPSIILLRNKYMNPIIFTSWVPNLEKRR